MNSQAMAEFRRAGSARTLCPGVCLHVAAPTLSLTASSSEGPVCASRECPLQVLLKPSISLMHRSSLEECKAKFAPGASPRSSPHAVYSPLLQGVCCLCH